jgi:hypothetical protein
VSVKVAGLDLSMMASGVCHTGTGDDADWECQTGACWHLIKPREDKDFRLPEIKSRIKRLVTDHDLVLIEMLPPHMKGAGITGMVQGVTREMLLEEGIRYGDVGPSALKKYATGKGNASKTEMALAALKRGGIEFSNDNECDGWWLWVMARDFKGEPVFDLPQVQRAELKHIEMKG